MKRFINNNFTTFVVGSLTVSMVSGWACLSYIQDQQTKKQPFLRQPASVLDGDEEGDSSHDNSKRIKSREELRLKAMVENALQSTWEENLNNAFQAHERFMLPGRDHGKDPKFMKKIDERAEKLLKKQSKKLREQRQFDGTDTESDHKDEHEDNQEDKTEFWK